MVVVSNWDVSLVEVLERLGLGPLLDEVVTSAAIGARKPDAGDLRHGAALAGVRPDAGACTSATASTRTSHGARAAGSRPCCCAATASRRADGVRTITTLAEPGA